MLLTKNLKDDYSLGRVLGQGQYGTTFLYTHNETGQKLACKSIPKRKLLRQEHFDRVLREIQIMHHLSEYANVVRIHSTYEDATSVHFVMELGIIVKKGHHSEREVAKLIKTIVSVVEAFHSLGVMHRDLKSTDFGLSVFCKPGLVQRTQHGILRATLLGSLSIRINRLIQTPKHSPQTISQNPSRSNPSGGLSKETNNAEILHQAAFHSPPPNRNPSFTSVPHRLIHHSPCPPQSTLGFATTRKWSFVSSPPLGILLLSKKSKRRLRQPGLVPPAYAKF
ncbi:hypothetical protein Bca52824_030435 [Brassica carinata]|uniref:Protein kinase domain-containing protein n=1 Tax=Brassica carinata TaxID=52824 RepID=A0A8X7V4C5_BRACI|nr:hypothetical protein Bca52824_030435 [Brassica carinata]